MEELLIPRLFPSRIFIPFGILFVQSFGLGIFTASTRDICDIPNSLVRGDERSVSFAFVVLGGLFATAFFRPGTYGTHMGSGAFILPAFHGLGWVERHRMIWMDGQL